VSDDARGLAALLATVRALVALTAADAGLRMPLLLVGSVGEEGIGDLRGMRALFGPGGAGAEARGFISLDGAGVARVISSGVGSRRFRVEVTGPGGHSWVDWGRANPIQILGRAIAALDALPLPAGCTLNVGRIQGGTSINAIPTEAWMEVEVRSEDEDQLGALEAELRQRVEDAMDGGRAGDAAPPVTADGEPAARLSLDRIGQRPGGRTPMGAPLVRAAVAATRAVAGFAEVGASSTDANLPMSLGIPAITLGAGGEAGDAHTPREWYRNRKGPDGVVRALLTLLVLDRAATGP
jgi:acetylornithine deacetylase/succinyl-diaminopimelate desuccinylase-like protein